MSFEQPVTAAEAELERLLSIEPSIGFRARVRERVANESPGARRLPWRLTFATAGVLIAVAAGLLIDQVDVSHPSPPRSPRPVMHALHRPDAVPFVTPAPLALAEVGRRQAAPRGAREPEVIWDSRSADAIARVVDLARQGTVVIAPKAPDANPMAVPPLFVAPICTDLLVLPTESERSSS